MSYYLPGLLLVVRVRVRSGPGALRGFAAMGRKGALRGGPGQGKNVTGQEWGGQRFTPIVSMSQRKGMKYNQQMWFELALKVD